MISIPGLIALAKGWIRCGFRSSNSKGEHVYRCTVVQEDPGWLVIEIGWEQMCHFLKWRPRFNAMAYDPINVTLDFSGTTSHPDLLRSNQALRIRKGSRTMEVLILFGDPFPNTEVHPLWVRKLSLAHIERHFAFNFVTWPWANALPFILVGTLFAIWGIYDGWRLHESPQFFAAVPLLATLTALGIAVWRLIVQESDKRHDARCRRLENELMIRTTEQLSNRIGSMLERLQNKTGR